VFGGVLRVFLHTFYRIWGSWGSSGGSFGGFGGIFGGRSGAKVYWFIRVLGGGIVPSLESRRRVPRAYLIPLDSPLVNSTGVHPIPFVLVVTMSS